MKSNFLFLILLLVLFFSNACSAQIGKKLQASISNATSDLVIVKLEKAIFIFKLNQKGNWKWHQKKKPKPPIEYRWMAVIHFPQKGYMVGFVLQYIPIQNPSPDHGSLKELIETGRIILYSTILKRKKMGKKHPVVRSTVQSTKYIDEHVIVTSSNTFAIIVNKKDIINKFKKFRPKDLIYTFFSQTEGHKRKKVKIKYAL